MNGTQARAELGFLRSVDWIDQQTRAVVADMNVYRSGWLQHGQYRIFCQS